MGPKKPTEKDSITENEETHEQLITEVRMLRQKLTNSEEDRESLIERLRRNEQDSVLQRDDLVTTYQQRINDITSGQASVAANGTTSPPQDNDPQNTRVRRKYEVQLPRQIIFDGRASWESFIHPFEAMVEACRWDDSERLFRFKNSFRDHAAEYAFRQLGSDELSSYDRLKSAMSTRFQEKRSTSSYLAELENRKFIKEKESLAEYVAAIKRLVFKGYPTADSETRETINLRHFLKGLLDSQAALLIGMQDPKTIDQAREMLDNYSSIREDVKGGMRVRSVDTNKEDYVTESRLRDFGRDLKSDICKKIDQLANQMNPKNQNRGQPAYRRSKTDVECYNCHRTGHYARECKDNTQRKTNSEN